MRILLADTHALTREGLKRVALDVDDSSEFIEVADGAQAESVLRSKEALDAALFDNGLFTPDELSALRRERPQMRWVALTTHADTVAPARWFAAGTHALVPKSASADILSATLRLVIAGNVYVRGSADALPLSMFADRPPPSARRGTGPLNLTSRQYDVLALVSQGRANKAIAEELGIGLRTVKGHVSVILRALHVDNRVDAGRAARRWRARAQPSRAAPA